MLHQLLWKSRGRWQIIGASMGVFIGLFLLLLAIQVFLDVQLLLKGARDANVLIINKSAVKNLGKKLEFSPDEVALNRSQPFFKDVGIFESSQYTVSAASDQLGFYTQCFFQMVPNRFLDVDTSQFVWNSEQDEIPIILSSDYLALYNFGFAPAQGSPTFTPETVALVELDINITGKGKVKKFKGRVYDFSRNINSILVPASFMAYANREFGDQNKPPTQLIATTDNPYNRNLNDFLDQQGYEISRGGLIGGELKTTLQLLLVLIIVIGLIIIGLSMLVFVLNFQLLIAQAREDIRWLIQLGYKDSTITQFLAKRLFRVFALVFIAVCICIIPIKYVLSNALITQGYSQLSTMVSLPVWAVAIGLCAFLLWINWRSIQKNVRRLA